MMVTRAGRLGNGKMLVTGCKAAAQQGLTLLAQGLQKALRAWGTHSTVWQDLGEQRSQKL